MLVLIAFDQFQVVCYPLSNHYWQPMKSNLKIALCWIISLLLCIPQAVMFGLVENTETSKSTCSFNFYVKKGKFSCSLPIMLG